MEMVAPTDPFHPDIVDVDAKPALDDQLSMVKTKKKNQKWEYLEFYIEQIIVSRRPKSPPCCRSLGFCLQIAD